MVTENESMGCIKYLITIAIFDVLSHKFTFIQLAWNICHSQCGSRERTRPELARYIRYKLTVSFATCVHIIVTVTDHAYRNIAPSSELSGQIPNFTCRDKNVEQRAGEWE